MGWGGVAMELRTRNGNRRLLVAVLALTVTASHAQASSLARQCRKACADEVATCVATGRRARDCRRDIVRVCIGQGIATCDPTAGSSSTSHNLRLSSSALSAPGSLSATGVSTTAIALSWIDTNAKEAGYIVERALPPGTAFTAIATLGKNAQSYTDSGLVPAATYYYRVQTYARGGSYSAYSNVSSATTLSPPDTTPPTVPTG